MGGYVSYLFEKLSGSYPFHISILHTMNPVFPIFVGCLKLHLGLGNDNFGPLKINVISCSNTFTDFTLIEVGLT